MKSLFAVIAATCSLAAAGLAFFTPVAYRSQSRLMLIPSAKDPAWALETRARHVRRAVLSSEMLHKIIQAQTLRDGDRARMPLEDVIIGVRRDIGIDLSQHGETLIVSYSSKHRDEVVRGCREVVERVLGEDVRATREIASNLLTLAEHRVSLAAQSKRNVLDRAFYELAIKKRSEAAWLVSEIDSESFPRLVVTAPPSEPEEPVLVRISAVVLLGAAIGCVLVLNPRRSTVGPQ